MVDQPAAGAEVDAQIGAAHRAAGQLLPIALLALIASPIAGLHPLQKAAERGRFDRWRSACPAAGRDGERASHLAHHPQWLQR